ncbi:MAG TPA: MBL fold metallo-hydrolase [Steroidobacteraceae bacterium]|nr:MBL fold metallo-hydrolase [Steroidobacteraceae bacterium]
MKQLAVALALSAMVSSAIAQQPISLVAQKHIDAARAAAGSEHQAIFKNVCDSAVAFATPAPARPAARPAAPAAASPAQSEWYAEPQKVFDNLYYVGMTEYSVWAITTSQGIIVLDAIFDYSVEAEVDQGLRKLGLNPADIKYVIVSHGHGDHAGGAKYLQEKYGAHVVMSAADYDLLDRQNPRWKPKRDMVVTDGQKLTLGDTTVTLYLTPGHTEGTISTIFPVRDGRAQHTVATWGGTAFNFGPNRDRLKMYSQSADRFLEIAKQAKADVLLSNHTVFDGSKVKMPELKTRKAGDPHPYVVGPEVVQRFVTTVGECAKAAVETTAPASAGSR